MPITQETNLEPVPPEEAMAYFKGKVLLKSQEYYTLLSNVRTKAFTVSRVASMDVLSDIQGAVQAAIDNGETLRDFMGRLGDVMEQRGWSGLKPWHAEVVFRNGIQASYSVGKEEQYEGYHDEFPYAQYYNPDDERSRPEHAQWNGMIFPVDDPFWDVWTPPSGYNCFPLGTKVLTPSGWKAIESIAFNDVVIGGSGSKQKAIFIHKNLFNGNLISLIFEGGEITSTPNHRILTTDGWKRADCIKNGDILVQTRKVETVNRYEEKKRFSDDVQGAPLDRFGTMDDFRSWAEQNAIMYRVEGVESVPYNGTVINLSIDRDNSYIVDGATVHNCRCQKRYIHKYEMESRGLEASKYTPSPDNRPPKGFDVNPAKVEWSPNKEDYPKELWKQYEAEKEAVGK